MIVKNEQDWIRQCLESVRSIVCESIVVDTGSSDETVAIATDCGAKVLQFTWCDDFAAARNFSLSHASGDWILVLDADETIAPGTLAQLQQLTADRSVCHEFAQRHYTDDHRLSNFTPFSGEFPEYERGNVGFFESWCVRLFPNHLGLHFQGKVHELVEHSIAQHGKLKIKKSAIRIHHFGHTLAVKSKKNKTNLYQALGRSKTELAPTDWKGFYELGVELNCAGKLHDSARAFVRAIECNPMHVPTWTNLGYVFCELGQYPAAIDALIHASKIDPRSAEAACNLGVVYMRLQQYQTAEKILKQALAINPQYVNAMCNLAETLAQMGRLSEAAFYYRNALKITPNCATAMAGLGALYFQAGIHDQAETLLRQACEHERVRPQAQLFLSELLKATGQIDEATSILNQLAADSNEPSSNQHPIEATKS